MTYCICLTVHSIQYHSIWDRLIFRLYFHAIHFKLWENIFSAAVDEDEFPELILPDDPKNDDNNNDCSNSNKNNDCSNSNNNDNSTCIGPDIEHANSTYSPHLGHLNKRRRVDSKKSNSDVKSSLKSERGLPENIVFSSF